MVGGLSKSAALTGFRIGYLLGPPAFIKQVTLAHQLMVTCAPRLSQLLALEIFRTPGRLTAHLPDYRAAREAVLETKAAFPAGVELAVGSGAFYATIELGTQMQTPAYDLALEALEAVDVAVVPGCAFGGQDDFIRISYAGGVESTEAGLRRLATFLRAKVGGG